MSLPQDAGGDPAADLGPVWDALDALPRASASAHLAATTVELAAVATGGAVAARGGERRRGTGRWLAPAAVVAVALVAGVVAGRGTAPDPDLKILAGLPLVQHLELLREAGSTKFLEEMLRRKYPLPLRAMLRPGDDGRADERRQFDADLVALRAALVAGTEAGTLEARRQEVQALPAEERVELERAAESFARLSAAERRTLDAVARALADPARTDLRDAAWQWRQWLRMARPEDRAEIVARGTDKRLEWIDWYSRRLEGRGGERPPRGPDLRPRWPRAEGPGAPPLDAPAFGPAMPRGPRRDERPPFTPDASPRPAPPADDAETRAAPR